MYVTKLIELTMLIFFGCMVWAATATDLTARRDNDLKKLLAYPSQ